LRIEGGKPFHGVLPHPPTTTGVFANLPVQGFLSGPTTKSPEYYSDSEVIAFKAPAGDVAIDTLEPKITTNAGQLNAAWMTDGDYTKSIFSSTESAIDQPWIQYEFAQPQVIQAVSFATRTQNTGNFLILESGNDTGHFTQVAEIRPLQHGFAPSGNVTQTTVAFTPVTARFYRIRFKSNAAAGQVSELVLHPGARVNHVEEKDGFSTAIDLYAAATPSGSPASATGKNDVIVLTGKMQPDGTLDWAPPPGDWVVLRFGSSLTGATNEPAPADATGLEVDKFDHAAVKAYMEHYLDLMKSSLGPELMGKRGLRYVINDSWEAANQNWTDDMVADFTRLRGYDPRPWMPVLAGHIVESTAASDRFLWDFRKTIADLIATEHYGQIETTLHAYGLLHYSESQEDHRAFVADGMQVKKYSEVPMGAMWTQAPGVNKTFYDYNTDDRESASVAHIYGRKMAAAESMTATRGAWAWTPETLKPTADQEFLNGINRFAIHESTHQALIGKEPGLSLGPVGQWFNRNETWANQAVAWIDYLARCSYLLQQGNFRADILYYYGEDSNLTGLFGDKAPDLPAGYGFDYINADALIHELTVRDHHIETKSGMSYRVLSLDPFSKHMSLPVLKAIEKLVKDGATVAGSKPDDDPSLADDQMEFKKLSDRLFGDGTGVHQFGKGTVYAGKTVGEALTAMQVQPDFEYSKAQPDTHLEFVHRALADGDIYFVDNRGDRAEQTNAIFRVKGKAAQLWR
jgi:hypothetical protein